MKIAQFEHFSRKNLRKYPEMDKIIFKNFKITKNSINLLNKLY